MTHSTNMRILRLSVDDQQREARNAQADYDTIRARRILATPFDGKTASDREQQIKLFVATDEDIVAASAQLRHAEYLRDRAVSILEAAKDERRAAELDARNRRTAAYERMAIQRDRPDHPGVDAEDDDQVDDTIDDWQYQGITEKAATRREGRNSVDDASDLPW